MYIFLLLKILTKDVMIDLPYNQERRLCVVQTSKYSKYDKQLQCPFKEPFCRFEPLWAE